MSPGYCILCSTGHLRHTRAGGAPKAAWIDAAAKQLTISLIFLGFQKQIMHNRIALISEHASPLAIIGGVDAGGQNIYVSHLARCLARAGHEVDIFTRQEAAHQPMVVNWEPGIRIIHIKAGPASILPKEALLPYMGEFSANIVRFARMQVRSYDLAHANFFMSGMAAMALKRHLGIPYVITFHALGRVRKLHQREADAFPDERLAIEGALLEDADQVIAECPQDKDDLIEHYGADPEKITIIPCGYDPLEFAPLDKREAREHLGLDPEEPIVLQLGRMVPRKGVETVIRGVARLNRHYGHAVRLLVVGGNSAEPDPLLTPEIGRLQQIARDQEILDQVTFTGSRSRDVLKYYYSAADIFVTMPWYEPFGITPLEAMACATPVIGSNVGGIKHTVIDGQTGYLVPPYDTELLAKRLAYLYERPHLRHAMGRNAQIRVQREFTWEKIAAQVACLYQDVIDTGLMAEKAVNQISQAI
jgi:D-inositol-3-phosphate glycosyltransferase